MEKQLKEVDTWYGIRASLNNSYDYSEDWSIAINLFEVRMRKKYFNAIQNLISLNKNEGEGFAIVTIQCAIIETFAAFEKGKIYNRNKQEADGLSYEYKSSSALFVDFLNTAPIFKNIFHSTDKNGNSSNAPFCANHFYTKVRCGLMHEAKTKGDWHINATNTDDPKDKKFIKQKKKGNIIYRTLLQYALEEHLKNYISNLKNPDDQFNDLRKLFARKMDNLFEIRDNYNWWNT